MAPSAGRRKDTSSVSFFVFLCFVLYFVPYIHGFSLPKEELKLSVSHDAKLGHVVLKEILNTSCIELHHVAKLPQYTIGSPVTVNKAGSLIVKVPLTGRIGDTVVIVTHTSFQCSSITRSTVSFPTPVYVEVKHANDILHFIHDTYFGTLKESSRAGTVVEGIADLYACSKSECRNNVDYKIHGSTQFYLQTRMVDGKIVVQISSRERLPRGTHHFIITATDDHGHTGHTNIQVDIQSNIPLNIVQLYNDDSLHFVPSHKVRTRRATREQLNEQNVLETETGVIFSVKQTTNNWEYSLLSSTYENAFTVSATGDVSVATGRKLDYEYLTASNLSTTVTLIITVINKDNDEVVKELEQKINILDVNDELPVFLNKPVPFFATVSNNAAANTLVYSLTASDPDKDSQLVLTVTNNPGPEYLRVEIVGNTRANILRLGSQAFNVDLIRIQFQATDTNATSQVVNEEVLIKVGSRSPQFFQINGPIRFPELNAEGQTITTEPIRVISFQKKAVTFTVLRSQDQPDLFRTRNVDITSQMDNVRGCHLYVTRGMDYEQSPRAFNVTIRATEAETGFTSTIDANIEVFDINEFAPRFSVSTYKKENVKENVVVGTSLLAVTASDEDFNTALTFTVSNDNFRVAPRNVGSTATTQIADIYVNKALDYDRISPKLYDFSVIASDNGKIRKTGAATVRIFMSNLNDEKPVFPALMTTDVRFDTQVNREIFTVQATDEDNGDIVSYRLQGIAPPTNLFALEDKTGRITLRSTIATDQADITTFQYKMTIVATDDGGCCGGTDKLSSTGTLTIQIRTDNLYRPVFKTCSSYQPSVMEEVKNAPVITVSATDEDHGIYGNVKYSIRGSNSQFRINETTGELFTNETIDREKLVFGTSVTVNVLATDGGNLQGSCSLLVRIEDKNDHAPVFASPDGYTFKVQNTLTVNQVAATVSATDKDIGENAVITYSFVENPGDLFKFDETSAKTGAIKVAKLLTTQPENSVISLKVKAEDNGSTPLHTNVSVVITLINDPNIKPPVWPSGTYSVSVKEGTARNINILNISATSQNQDKALSFTIVEKDLRKLFYVQTNAVVNDVQLGALKTNELLDYETKRQYKLTLRATDIQTDMQAEKVVTVDVTDINDVRPVFVGIDEDNGWLSLSIDEGNYSSSEFLPRGKLVGQISATDGDGQSPNNLIQRYAIQTVQTDFTIDSTSGEVYTRGDFDRETKNTYSLTVIAVDGDASSEIHNTAQMQLKVIITDINDNAPYFTQNYVFTAKEDLLVGSVVDRVQALDKDSDAILKYSIISDSSTQLPFTIQQETGDIKVIGALDYDEGIKTFHFKVSVDDTSFSSSTNVTINLIDVNDNPPKVPDYEFIDIQENDTSTVGQILETINATDIDNGGVNTFYYDIKFTEAKYSKYFTIDRVTGELKIAQVLDRDEPNGLANFVFTVEVSDAQPGQNPLIGYGTISVKPIDINDNRPIFPVAHRQMSVKENQTAGVTVGRVVVVDYDAGENAEWTLTVLQQMPATEFSLVGTEIKTLSTLDREKIDQYFVVLQAVDKGTPALTGTGTVTIEVLDVNDNAPYFNTTYTFILSESQKSGEFGRITAYDKDIGINAQLTYSLAASDTKYFRMDVENNQGVLKIFEAVDYDNLEELQRNFNLTAYAKDISPGQNNERQAMTTILVEVTDYNDETPKFEINKKQTTVPEDVKIGYVLAQFNATDRDVDPNYGSFRYFIARKTDPLNQFAINDQGQVSIKNTLDRETNAFHIVDILAIDNINGFPQNTGTATLTVTVTDINDNYPDFADALSPSIMENETLVNRLVVTFSANDADEPDNGAPFFFSLNCSVAGASTQCNKFTLDFRADTNGKATGSLYVSGNFDREFEEVVMLPIWMCDVYNMPSRARDQQCGIRFLNVLVKDKDDEKHNDGFQSILVYNYKGLFGDFKIGTVNDNDKDEVVDKDSKDFTLLNAAVAGLFVLIDPKNGGITLKKKVPEMSFEIKVRVTDATNRARTSTVRITVVYITEDAVYNSGSVRINGITPEDFLFRPKTVPGPLSAYDESMYEQFRNKLADSLYGSHSPANLEKVQVLSVMKAGDTATDVRFSAHGSPWYQSSRMDGIVTANQADFNKVLDVGGKQGQIDMVPIDMCQQECEGGGCYNELVVGDTPVLINTKGTSFVGVKTEVRRQCKCRAKDFSGEIQCEPGYCYHGGACTKDNWGVVSCSCPAGFDGPRCQQLRQSFDGSGYAMYPQLEQCEESRTSIQILTTKSNGIILYNGPTAELSQTAPRDFILLELVNGYPRLRINHGTGEMSLEITGAGRKKLNDGSWHTIDIYRKNIKIVTMVVDHCVDSTVTNKVEDRSSCEVSGVTPGEHIFVNTGSLLQLGGRMSTPSYPANVITDGFEGCMKNLIHNAEIYDLSTGGQFPGAKDGCEREDNACKPAGCGHGQCLITGMNQGKPLSRCICDAGNRTSTSTGTCDTATTIRDFGDQSFVDWNLKQTFKALLNSRMTRVSFHFRTRDTSGVIFSVKDQSNSNKYITFKIIDSRLQVAYNLGDDKYDVPLSNVQASDGQWHKVVMERFGKEFILKIDSGEGRYYAETAGPTGGAVDFIVSQNQVHAGGSVVYDVDNRPSYTGAQEDDFQSSCLNDIRLDQGWFPLKNEEEDQSPAATFEVTVDTKLGCIRDDCTNKCRDPFVCLPLWEAHDCVCKEHYIKNGDTCIARDYCSLDEPCFGNAVCKNNVPPGKDELPYTCICPATWYGSLCQCHPSLNPSGAACNIEGEEDPAVSIATGAIVAIILAIVVLIAAIIIIMFWVWRRGKTTEELLDDDMDDDIRENVMYYDEEGAGEEDQTRYDLSRLRKPDDGERPGVWSDAPDIPHKPVLPLGGSSDRPDIGDFISGRLNDADDDPGSPPHETPTNFNYEGGGSDAGSLSSLNTSSSGDQDYDYLNEWGPKFAKLADMYNNYDSD